MVFIPGHDATAGKAAFAAKAHAAVPVIQGTPGSTEYIAKVKAMLKAKLGADNIGEDTNNDGMYAGKKLALGGGGRTQLLMDKIIMNLVQGGSSYENAAKIAKGRAYAHGVEKYGKAQMQKWAGK